MSTQTTTTDQLGPRGNTPINSANRGAVRRWLTARGARYNQIATLTMPELSRLYNDASDETLNNLLRETGAPIPKTTAAPSPEQAWQQFKSQAEPILAEPLLAPIAPATTTTNEPTTTTTPETMTAPTTPTTTLTSQQAARLAALEAILNPAPAVDEAAIIALIRQHAPTPEPRQIHITTDRQPLPTVIDRQHYKFELLLKTIAARVPAYLVGPAGTGKTHSAKSAAEALGLQHAAISVGPMTSKGDLFGMRDAHGVYHESDLVRIAREGGVFLFDEFDSGNAGVLTSINMLLANGEFPTPAGMVKKHADFVPIFGLNTYGTGASREYVGRNQLDAATLDRGAFIDWPIDEGLEAHLVGLEHTSPIWTNGGTCTMGAWLGIVQGARRKVADLKIRHIISPRATLYGAAMIAQGIGTDHLIQTLLIKGLDQPAIAKLFPSLAH